MQHSASCCRVPWDGLLQDKACGRARAMQRQSLLCCIVRARGRRLRPDEVEITSTPSLLRRPFGPMRPPYWEICTICFFTFQLSAESQAMTTRSVPGLRRCGTPGVLISNPLGPGLQRQTMGESRLP